MPTDSLSVRRQRTYSQLVQTLPTTSIWYRDSAGSPQKGWPDEPLSTPAATKMVGRQETVSEEHPGWRQRLKDADSRQDIGGDFWSQKQYVEGIPTHLTCLPPREYMGFQDMYKHTRVSGPFWAIDARKYGFPPSFSSTNSQLDALGATAVARCRPTNSAANLGVALGELVREGVPKLAVQSWQRRAQKLRRSNANAFTDIDKAIGDDYLAGQFGLAPLGSEIGTFAAQVLQADRLLAQYERDAGRVVRRRYEFPTKTESTLTDLDTSDFVYGHPGNPGLLRSGISLAEHRRLKVRREIVQRRWFAGAFTYALPFWYDASSEMSRKALLAKEILGLDLDEEVIWNLAPWSWAVDWFTNAGDVISNVSSYREDGLLMRYGYMMEHTIVKDTYTRAFPNTLIGGSIDSFVTLVTETKTRRRANPFGFGLTWNGLSTFQASILAALGITRR